MKIICTLFFVCLLCVDNVAYSGQLRGGGIITPRDAVNAFQAFFWEPEAQTRKVKIAVKVMLPDGRITYINKEDFDETCIDKNSGNPGPNYDSTVPVLRGSCLNAK